MKMTTNYGNTGALGGASKNADEQIAELRAQVEKLMGERVTPVVSDVAAKAGAAAQQARDFAKAQVDTVATTISERPLTALAIALGIGYVLGRGTR
jgi:ElaB/YqjD/DUF883 family membrane-anchored ribosome-binding protein